MSRTLLVAIALLIVASASHSQQPPPKDGVSLLPKGAKDREKAWAPNLSQAFLRCKEEKKPMVILFGADWAIAHMRLRREVFDTATFDRFVDKAVFVLGNPDRDDRFENVKKKMAELGIDSFPTFVVLDEKLMEIDRITGRWDTDIYVSKMEVVFRNVETFRKTGKTEFGEHTGDNFHPYRLDAKLAAAGKPDVAKMVLDPKARLTDDRLQALLLQADGRTILHPVRDKVAPQHYSVALQSGRVRHSISIEVADQTIVLRRKLAGFAKVEAFPHEALRKMLQQKTRSGASYGIAGTPPIAELVLTMERDITVERFAAGFRQFVEDSDVAVAQVLPLLAATSAVVNQPAAP